MDCHDLHVAVRDVGLAKHHAIGTCAAGHRKIDPFGFALEKFGAIGA